MKKRKNIIKKPDSKFTKKFKDLFKIGLSDKELLEYSRALSKTQSVPVSGIQHIGKATAIKKKILKKHMILGNVNVILKLLTILFTFAIMIFFAVVSSEGITTDNNIRHLISIGHLVFIWPTITAAILFVIEVMLFIFIYYKRKWIHFHEEGNKLGQFVKLRKLTNISIALYSLTTVFVIFMFGFWFNIIDGAFGSYQDVFNSTFNYYLPAIGDFKDIFIILFSVVLAIEVSVIATLIAIQVNNKKYWQEFFVIIPKEQVLKMKQYKAY